MRFTKFFTILLLSVVFVSVFAGCGKAPAGTVETMPKGEAIEMTYLSVMLPETIAENLAIESVVDGDAVVEVFSLKMDPDPIELFRIFYGKAEYGNRIGVLNIDGEATPVSVSTSNYDSSFFANEDSGNQYYAMMESLNIIIGAIQADPRFSSDEGNSVDKVDTQVAQWNFYLPEMVQWEEIRNEGSLMLTFFAEIKGERVDLYVLAIGGEPRQSVLGQYKIDGEIKSISIGSCPGPDMEEWAENEIMNYYQMMDSINDVIQTIQGDENFSRDGD